MARGMAVRRALAAAATFVVVMLAVTAALEDVIYFSLFVGVPAGIVAALVVWAVMHLASRPDDGGSRP